MLRNLKFRTLIILIAGVGLASAIFAAQFDLREQRAKVQSVTGSMVFVELSLALSVLVDNLQKERGASAVYLTSKGQTFQPEMLAQRIKTDAEIRKVLGQIDVILPTVQAPDLLSILKSTTHDLAKLPDVRSRIDRLDMTRGEQVAFYTSLNRESVTLAGVVSGEVGNAELAKSLLLLSSVLLAKDYAGLERAMGASAFSNGGLNPTLRVAFASAVASQDALFTNVTGLLHAADRAALIAMMESPESVNVQTLRETLLSGSPAEIAKVTPKIWFDAISAKIGQLKSYSEELGAHTLEYAEALGRDATALFYFHSANLLATLLATVILSCLVYRSLSLSFAGVLKPLKALAKGQQDITLPHVTPNEFGEIASALGVFHKNELARLDQEATKQKDIVAQNLAMAEMERGLQDLANGDLNVQIDIQFDDAYEGLRTDFNAAMRKLNDAFDGLKPTSSAVRDMASGLEHASENLSRRTVTQAATLEQTAAVLNTLNSNVQSASEGARQTTKITAQTKADAERSGEVVNKAVQSMERLEASSVEIAQITDVIDEIAFQTNLLALNAGVEAARAGPAGQGFAVVASEVRSLAQRSADAAKEINSLVTVSEKQVNEGVELVREAGDSLSGIISQVGNISNLMEDLASGSEEQAISLSEISEGVNQMDQVTQQNAEMVEQTLGACRELNLQIDNLNGSISEFSTASSQSVTGVGSAATYYDVRAVS